MNGLITFLLFSWWGSIVVGKFPDILGGGAYGIRMALLITIPFGIQPGFFCLWTCKYYPQESAEADKYE